MRRLLMLLPAAGIGLMLCVAPKTSHKAVTAADAPTYTATPTAIPVRPLAVVDIPESAYETTPTPEAARATVTAADAELLARLLWRECRGEEQDGWRLVAQVVLDRLHDGQWGDTVESVIGWPGQFAKPATPEAIAAAPDAYIYPELLAVAEAALAGERFKDDMTILYFRKTDSTADWFAPYLGHCGGHAYYGDAGERDVGR